MVFNCINIFKTMDSIVHTIIRLHEILLNISCILNSDIRRDIFIGITGLMVAIIIFIAEVISNKKMSWKKESC